MKKCPICGCTTIYLRRRWITNYKLEHPCIICGETFPGCLDFHHINPAEKKYSITSMINSCFTVDNVLTEAKKCVILCANCHRKVHAGIIKLPEKYQR